MKRFVQVGCGIRGIEGYAEPILKEYRDHVQLCGVYDVNHKRAALVSHYGGVEVPVYDDFDKMLNDVKPHTVIVTTKDCMHDFYVIKALKAGCDVIVEKPLTTTFEKANAIKKAEEESGKHVTVVFNLRYLPIFVKLKELISSGVIGDVLSVHFEWLLDTQHGADYFRRWHRQRENSGSLLVHKSTHHFDLVNWFLDDDPVAVNAFGSRRFYGPTRENRSERCLTCQHKDTCEFYLDINQPPMDKLYLECEDVDGYYRDRCIFSEEIDIEDSVSVNVLYKKGAVMSYSLTAHSPYEGMRIAFNGSEGRLEFCKIDGRYPELRKGVDNVITIINRKGEKITMNEPTDGPGGHGGADERIQENLFVGCTSDPLGQMADTRAGMMSIGIGMAANVSMAENRRVYLSEFYGDL
ncbi:MAG: Gfo/Idh/MocA family oxidoreductase [Clostridia bacterium]|nr:Gfo/Idh/MocA family oxidoreductase [Clostridia bacterium]